MRLAEWNSQMLECPFDEKNGSLPESVDTGTSLAEPDKLEILLFSLGSRETFGISVSHVREVCRAMHVTKTPNMPHGVAGIVSLRGDIMSVLMLAKFIGLEGCQQEAQEIMMVAEYSNRTIAFMVHGVDRIIRVGFDKVSPLNEMLAGKRAMVSAVTELSDGKLVSLLDVRQVFIGAFGDDVAAEADHVEPGHLHDSKRIHKLEAVGAFLPPSPASFLQQL